MMDAGYEMTLVDVSPEDESSQRSGGSTLAGNGSTARRGGGRNSRERSVERESEKIGLLGFGGGGGFGGGPSSQGNFPQNSLTPQQQSWAVVIKLVLLLVVAILVGATLGAVSRLASSLSGSAAGPGSTLGAFEVAGDEKSWLRIYLSKSSPQRVLFRIPQSSLGKLFIRSDLTEHGSGHGGLGVPSNIAHTQVDGENPALFFNLSSNGAAIDLYRKQLEVRTSVPEDNILLREGGTDQWIQQFDVLQITQEQDIVFEVTSMVLTDVFYLNFAAGAYPLKELQLFQSFPRNSNFIVQSSNPSTMATTSVFVSLALLPDVPMVGRTGDRRIGYFSTEYTDLGEHDGSGGEGTGPAGIGGTGDKVAQSARIDPMVRLISRWRLEKPEDTIRFYIDPSVPKRWRKYVKIGIELWQPSFQALGFTNTPRAVMPDDPDFPADYHSGDIRYASISFAMSRDAVFSVGPSIVDPRSGEILDADVGFAQEWVKAFTSKVELGALGGSTPGRRLSSAMSHSHSHSHAAPSLSTSCSGKDGTCSKLRGTLYALPSRTSMMSRHGCQHLKLRAEHDAHSLLSLSLGSSSSPLKRKTSSSTVYAPVSDEIVGRGLAGVTVHEIGHTLGLRHNFKGSSHVPFDKIFDGSYTKVHSSTSSVMDYVGAVIAPTAEQQNKAEVFPDGYTVGEYDRLAIEYGYTRVENEIQGVQHETVRAIAAKLATKGLEFGTDGDAELGEDPLARRYDYTDDPVSYAEAQVTVSQNMRAKALTAVSENAFPLDGHATYSRVMASSMRIAAHAAGNAAYHLGGRIISHDFPDDTRTSVRKPVRAVSAAYQRKALAVIRNFLRDDFYFDHAHDENSVQYGGTNAEWDNFYSVSIANLGLAYASSSKALISSVLDADKLQRIYRTHAMVSKGGGAVWEPSSSSPTRTTLSVLDVLRDFNSIIFGGGGDQDRPWTMHARWPVQEYYAREIASLSASLRSGAISSSSSSSSPSIEVMVEISRACCELRDTINGVLNGTVGSRVVDPLEVEFLNAALRAMAAAY